MYDVKVREIGDIDLFSIRHKGDYKNISESFAKLGKWGRDNNLIYPDTGWLGIYHDNPVVVALADLRSDACFIAPHNISLKGDGEIISTRLEKRKYACVEHKGSYDDLRKVYSYIYSVWGIKSDYSIDFESSPFEEYAINFLDLDISGEELFTVVCVPLNKIGG